MAMDSIRLTGRVLFLSEDPAMVQRQLHGEDLGLEAAEPLRNGVTMDEIAPTWVCYYFGSRLEDFPYLGLECRDSYPFVEGAVARGGFQVVVSGERHGSHGFREAALFAEFAAGVRLVLARSFSPDYLQHCQGLGLLTSTDFSILEPLRRGEALPMEWFTRGQGPLAAEITRNGGLFGYTLARLALTAELPLPHRPAGDTAPEGRTPMNLAEKILARAAVTGPAVSSRPGSGPGLPSVAAGDGLLVRTDWRFSHETVTNLAAAMLDMFLPDPVAFQDPAHILAFRDHLSLAERFPRPDGGASSFLEVARRLQAFQDSFCAAHGIRLHRGGGGGDADGISHLIMAERHVLPGQVVVGTDAHTCHAGALGALAFGVDAADLANAWVTGDVPFTVPPTCLVRLDGQLPPGVYAKDLVLHLLTLPALRDNRVAGWILEFQGEALAGLTTDERATLTNMAPVFGALSAIIAPDQETVRFLRERRGVEAVLEDWMASDPDAAYAAVVEVDCAQVGPMVAAPGAPTNAVPLARLDREVPVDIAYVGTCTGGKRDDIERAYEVVRWALDQGLTVPLQVQMFVQMGSEDVRRHAEEQGWVGAFEAAGARVISPGCGACIHAGPGVSTRADQVTIGAFNRNFPGRSGPGSVWLASPATVAASAFLGRICSFRELQEYTGE
jgi:3-isopropylmalate/(R)-2-methylmalate dehydratase large subunit